MHIKGDMTYNVFLQKDCRSPLPSMLSKCIYNWEFGDGVEPMVWPEERDQKSSCNAFLLYLFNAPWINSRQSHNIFGTIWGAFRSAKLISCRQRSPCLVLQRPAKCYSYTFQTLQDLGLSFHLGSNNDLKITKAGRSTDQKNVFTNVVDIRS